MCEEHHNLAIDPRIGVVELDARGFDGPAGIGQKATEVSTTASEIRGILADVTERAMNLPEGRGSSKRAARLRLREEGVRTLGAALGIENLPSASSALMMQREEIIKAVYAAFEGQLPMTEVEAMIPDLIKKRKF